MKKLSLLLAFTMSLFCLVANCFALDFFANSAKAINTWLKPTKCVAPYNINYVVTPDRKQVTFAWEEYPTTFPILNYQINNAENIPIWVSNGPGQHCFTDMNLPGTSGKFIFYFYSHCVGGMSAPYKFEINV